MKTSKQALTIYQQIDKKNQPVLLEQQMIHILQATPEEHIYQRPAKGGGEWDFVTGAYVKKALNYVFAWNWDFEIRDKGREGDSLWILGRLTVRSQSGIAIVKEQFGRADIKFKKGTKDPMDYGNDLKAASTDALKKCASELGIASDVYSKNEFKQIKTEVVPEDERQKMVDGDKPASDEQIETIKKFLPDTEWAAVSDAGYTRKEAAEKIRNLIKGGK